MPRIKAGTAAFIFGDEYKKRKKIQKIPIVQSYPFVTSNPLNDNDSKNIYGPTPGRGVAPGERIGEFGTPDPPTPRTPGVGDPDIGFILCSLTIG
jgi:hypothetical protein